MRSFRAAALPLLLAVASSSRAATLSGTVSLVTDGKARPDASNVVVWIEGVPHGTSAGNGSKSPRMTQSSKHFQPRVVVIAKDATVDFPNDDPVYHNVFSVSGGNRFDLGLYRSGSSKSKRFDETGLVRVY